MKTDDKQDIDNFENNLYDVLLEFDDFINYDINKIIENYIGKDYEKQMPMQELSK